jgi:hypothetical protein
LRGFWSTLIILLFFGTAHPAVAKKKPTPIGQVEAPKFLLSNFAWQITEAPSMLSEAIWVDKETSFLTISIVPASAFETTAPVVATDGHQIIPANIKLIPFVGQGDGLCTTNPPGEMTVKFFGSTTKTNNICFLDTDKDELFDQYFASSAGVIGRVVIPKIRNAAVPFGVSSVPVEAAGLTKNLNLQYYYGPLGASLAFIACFGKDIPRSTNMRGQGYYSDCLVPGASVGRSKMPTSFSLFGAVFAVEEEGEKRLLLRQIKPIVPQPFILN